MEVTFQAFNPALIALGYASTEHGGSACRCLQLSMPRQKCLVPVHLTRTSNACIELQACAGGVCEEAIYMASMLLEPECRITQTVRNADIIDNTFRVSVQSPWSACLKASCMQLLRCH